MPPFSLPLGNIEFGTLAQRPAANTMPANCLYYAYDIKVLYVNVVSDGVNTQAWVATTGPQNGNLDIYVDATNGVDTNPGTQALPMKTIPAAVLRAGLVGWTGYCHINLTADTYVLPSAASFAVDMPTAINGEPVCLIGTMVDSGLGARTVAASSAGSGSTFGTTTDTGGGLTVNQWQGYFLRYTSGTQSGKRYLIKSNTATIFTLTGTQTTPTNGDSYVVEKPGSIIRSSNNQMSVTASVMGAQNVLFDGQSGAASSFNIRGGALYHSSCHFINFASITANYEGGLFTMFGSASNFARIVFPSLSLVQTIGSYFNSNVASASVGPSRMGACDFQQCLYSGVNTTAAVGGYVQAVSCGYLGASALTAQGSRIQIANSRFETVTSVAGAYATATIVLDEDAEAVIQTVDVSNSTALALAVTAGSTANVTGLTGSGNVGASAVTLLKSARLVKSSGNTVTATTPGNDVQVGTNAATTAWATVNAGSVPESTALGTNTFCLASN